MPNSNNPEPRVRVNPRNPRALYEFVTLGDGIVIIKSVTDPREDLPVADGSAKAGKVPDARVTD
ncbi:MAG TPA: hypothetical protein VFU13_14890 [Steroidobacteraceae bacterium]|nr:hypothetical protein [Steroidobacteraceae bacterium]